MNSKSAEFVSAGLFFANLGNFPKMLIFQGGSPSQERKRGKVIRADLIVANHLKLVTIFSSF